MKSTPMLALVSKGKPIVHFYTALPLTEGAYSLWPFSPLLERKLLDKIPSGSWDHAVLVILASEPGLTSKRSPHNCLTERGEIFRPSEQIIRMISEPKSSLATKKRGRDIVIEIEPFAKRRWMDYCGNKSGIASTENKFKSSWRIPPQ
jgi:hypothetical protein